MNHSSQRPETVRYDFDRTTEGPTHATINVIAALANVPPTDLPLRLHDHIDPEALDELVDGTSDVSVRFSVDPYQVQVTKETIIVTYS